MAVVKEYEGLEKIKGPLIFIGGVKDVGYDEMVEITSPNGEALHGRVLEIGSDIAVVEVFEGTRGLSIPGTKVRFLGESLKLPVTTEMMGRVFNGLGLPIDGGAEPITDILRDINGAPINPIIREYPRDFIQTGISSIDLMNTLVRGQKLPIFSGSGLPHNQLAAQIVRQANILGEEEEFAVVFAAVGVKHDVADVFRKSFQESGALKNVVMFLNLADDPSIERLVTPRCALTIAEYLAFDVGMHVLVVITDMTNYCESLREISTSKGEVPSRKGYPGYLYSDLSSIFERAGKIKGKNGSITQIPILTMPNDDITHPIPDLSGYITEGQIVLSRDLDKKGIYPPINVMPSLSRLMNDGIGEGKTREDHIDLSSQIYSAYANTKQVEMLASVIGEEELSKVDRKYLEFGEQFEDLFIKQSIDEDRSIFESLDLGWKLLSILPRAELVRVKEEQIDKYLPSPMDE